MYRKYGKRLFDLIISVLILPIVILITIVVAILIYIDDRGPIFYNAERLGKDGKVFKMFKFRTMKVGAKDLRNEDGSTFNAVDDPRLTKIGKILRSTSIDELPQIFNVIKNDMSLIGPRPDLPEHLDYYNSTEKRKLDIKPGITGYNQAYFRNNIPWRDRIVNDVFYVNNESFIFDIKILVKTFETVVRRKNIYGS